MVLTTRTLEISQIYRYIYILYKFFEQCDKRCQVHTFLLPSLFRVMLFFSEAEGLKGSAQVASSVSTKFLVPKLPTDFSAH